MAEYNAKLLDSIGRKILSELECNARLPFTKLGRRVGLSTPAVMERVRRLELAGIITSYRAEVSFANIGYPILAFVSVVVGGDSLSHVKKLARTVPEILECHRVTGAHSFLLKVVARSVKDLERLIDRLSPYVTTTTSLVLSSTGTSRIVEPKEPPLERAPLNPLFCSTLLTEGAPPKKR
jgi:Lrp/AsnC family leucine-responsive transcriptional regulator